MSQYFVSGVLDYKPLYEEYPPFYHKYVDSLPAGNIFHILEDQLNVLADRLSGLTEQQWLHRYDAGKWSVKEVLAHLIDAERVFAFRALTFARGDQNELPGFDENEYVKAGSFDARPSGELLAQFDYLRKANLLLYSSFGDDELKRTGVANGRRISVHALVFITAGHVQHHTNILKERYGV